MAKKVIIIGSGIGGLGSANLLAKLGYEVTVLEKNDYLGGRAGLIEEAGYKFDKGPSWYLMPDVWEHYFGLLGKKVEDYLQLKRLEPSYRIFFEGGYHSQSSRPTASRQTFAAGKAAMDPRMREDDNTHFVDMYADVQKTAQYFESLEAGAGEKFKAYLKMTARAYETAKELFMYKNYDSVFDLYDKRASKAKLSPRLLASMHRYVSKEFKNERIQKILQYQLVFLGGSPYNTPALYSIMNHIDFNMGVFYPMGGIYEIINALVKIGREFGVVYKTNAAVKRIVVTSGRASGVELEDGTIIESDLVVSNADVYHTETVLLAPAYREHSEKYWQKRTLAPSAFIMYLGITDKVPELAHHNLLFAEDWAQNFADIFDHPKFPDKPSVYICAPSVTDATVAPAGKENLFVLAPIAPGLEYTTEFLEEYGNKLLDWMGEEMGVHNLRSRVEYRKNYCVKDFAADYNSFKGTALGLAHTLRQSVFLRPNNISKKVKDLYYVGAGTNPGIGMPICLISAELLVKRLIGNTTAEPLLKLE